MNRLQMRLGYSFACLLILLTSVATMFPGSAKADISCPTKQAFCNDVLIQGTFVDQNLVSVVFSGHYLNNNGQEVDLSFLNVNGTSGDFYSDNTGGTNYILGGNINSTSNNWEGYSGACSNLSGPNEQPSLSFFTGAPTISTDGNILQPSNLKQSFYALTIANLYYPDSAIETNGGSVSDNGNSCGGGNNKMTFVSSDSGASNGSPGGVKDPNTTTGVLATGSAADQTNGYSNSIAILGDNRSAADLDSGAGSSTNPAEITYAVASDGSIFRTDADPRFDKTVGTYVFSPDTGATSGDTQPLPNGFTQFISNYLGSGGCADVLSVTAASSGGIAPAQINHNTKVGAVCDNPNSSAGKGDQVYIQGSFVANQAATSTGSTPAATSGAAGGNATTAPTDNCEANGDPLSWIACPIIEALANAAEGIYDKVVEPLLKISPLDINNSSDQVSQDIYNAWSGFRIFGDIFLVIALLVIVFGESIGGGLIDAYTAKKVLPRLLIAAILVNLSIYIVAVLIDLTNIVGIGIVSLITEPFKNIPGAFNLTLNAGGNLGIDSLVTGGAIWAVASYGSIVETLLFVILIPLLLVFLSIVATVLIRRGIIILLVLISPVAFALYCLPNTEQHFKRWWDTLIKTLLVYPIIAVFFGLAQVMSATIKWGGQTSGLTASFADILSIIALFIPLALIPFAFRIAGGVIGRVHDLSSTARDRAHKMGETRRQRATSHLSNSQTARRENAYSALKKSASKEGGGAFRRNSLGLLARGVGGYNIEGKAAELTAAGAKQLNDQIATGKEQEIRGLSVNKALAYSRDPNGNGTEWRDNKKTGKREFKSLGGAWIDEADVDAGHRRWGNNVYAQQASLAREIDKAQTEDQIEHLSQNYKDVATGQGGWGMSSNQAAGAWQGATYQHQNSKLELKHSNWEDGSLLDGGEKLVNEVYEKRGSYGLAQMSSHTVEKLQEAYHVASGRTTKGEFDPQGQVDTDRQMKIKAIAETFVHEMGGGGIGGGAGEDIQQQMALANAGAQTTPLPPGVDPTSAAAARPRMVSTPGAAHVAERVRELAGLTGVAYDFKTGTAGEAPTGLYPPGHTSTTQENRREQ